MRRVWIPLVVVLAIALAVLGYAFLRGGEKDDRPQATLEGPRYSSAAELFDALERGSVNCDPGERRTHFDAELQGEKAVCKDGGVYVADVYVFDDPDGVGDFLDGIPSDGRGGHAIDAVVGTNWLVSADVDFLDQIQDALGGSRYGG